MVETIIVGTKRIGITSNAMRDNNHAVGLEELEVSKRAIVNLGELYL